MEKKKLFRNMNIPASSITSQEDNTTYGQRVRGERSLDQGCEPLSGAYGSSGSDSSASRTPWRFKNKAEKNKTFETIKDEYESYKDVREAMKKAGVESCNLIIGIDFTMSNLTQGKTTFGGKCLHDTSVVNPYREVISIFGETLDPIRVKPGPIMFYGFGEGLTELKYEQRACETFMEVYKAYELATREITLAGPTNFAPIIQEAIRIVKETNQFHILLIVADGQVTEEDETAEAIVEASQYPLSIIVVGVGDGPWKMMKEFDDELPSRHFDNFQFVNFHDIMNGTHRSPSTAVALYALMEIPAQYKCIQDLGYI